MSRIDKKYFENLDALRFMAFFSVFISHAFISSNTEISNSNIYIKLKSITEIGYLGLDFFFVLSSFLITWTIFEEYSNHNSFSLKKFVVRRALRIWPLYFLIVIIGYAAYYFMKFYLNQPISSIPDLYYFVFFILNFYIIKHGQEFLFFLVFLWSITVEEQFYLFWAIFLKFFSNYFVAITLLLIACSIIFRWYFGNETNQLYFNTISLLSNFGIGGLAGYLTFKTKLKDHITSLSKIPILIIYALLLISIVFFDEVFSITFFAVLQKLWFSLLFGLIILEQSFSKKSWFKVKNIPCLSSLGKISYGLYCFHGLVITILVKLLEQIHFTETYWHVFLIYPITIMIFTILFAQISFKYFEGYFLKLKSKFYTFAVIN